MFSSDVCGLRVEQRKSKIYSIFNRSIRQNQRLFFKRVSTYSKIRQRSFRICKNILGFLWETRRISTIFSTVSILYKRSSVTKESDAVTSRASWKPSTLAPIGYNSSTNLGAAFLVDVCRDTHKTLTAYFTPGSTRKGSPGIEAETQS